MIDNKKETDFDISCHFCDQCQQWRYFYCSKQSKDDWFCQLCGNKNTEVKYNERS